MHRSHLLSSKVDIQSYQREEELNFIAPKESGALAIDNINIGSMHEQS